jgi:hypothetical protein
VIVPRALLTAVRVLVNADMMRDVFFIFYSLSCKAMGVQRPVMQMRLSRSRRLSGALTRSPGCCRWITGTSRMETVFGYSSHGHTEYPFSRSFRRPTIRMQDLTLTLCAAVARQNTLAFQPYR